MHLQNPRESWTRLLSISLAGLLAFQVPLPGQDKGVPAPSLKIEVAKGEEGTNNIKKGTAIEPVVIVADEKGNPISGVMVMFTLPDSGPGGVFANDAKNLIVYTDFEGRAVARGLRPNHVAGKFEVRVDASFHGLTAQTGIHQTNAVPAATGISPKLSAILAIAGGAAAAGAIAASSGGKGTSTPTTPTTPPPTSSGTTLSAGTPTFGPPQ